MKRSDYAEKKDINKYDPDAIRAAEARKAAQQDLLSELDEPSEPEESMETLERRQKQHQLKTIGDILRMSQATRCRGEDTASLAKRLHEALLSMTTAEAVKAMPLDVANLTRWIGGTNFEAEKFPLEALGAIKQVFRLTHAECLDIYMVCKPESYIRSAHAQEPSEREAEAAKNLETLNKKARRYWDWHPALGDEKSSDALTKLEVRLETPDNAKARQELEALKHGPEMPELETSWTGLKSLLESPAHSIRSGLVIAALQRLHGTETVEHIEIAPEVDERQQAVINDAIKMLDPVHLAKRPASMQASLLLKGLIYSHRDKVEGFEGELNAVPAKHLDTPIAPISGSTVHGWVSGKTLPGHHLDRVRRALELDINDANYRLLERLTLPALDPEKLFTHPEGQRDSLVLSAYMTRENVDEKRLAGWLHVETEQVEDWLKKGVPQGMEIPISEQLGLNPADSKYFEEHCKQAQAFRSRPRTHITAAKPSPVTKIEKPEVKTAPGRHKMGFSSSSSDEWLKELGTPNSPMEQRAMAGVFLQGYCKAHTVTYRALGEMLGMTHAAAESWTKDGVPPSEIPYLLAMIPLNPNEKTYLTTLLPPEPESERSIAWSAGYLERLNARATVLKPSMLASDFLMHYRKAYSLTIKDLSAQVGVSEHTGIRWENEGVPFAQHESLLKKLQLNEAEKTYFESLPETKQESKWSRAVAAPKPAKVDGINPSNLIYYLTVRAEMLQPETHISDFLKQYGKAHGVSSRRMGEIMRVSEATIEHWKRHEMPANQFPQLRKLDLAQEEKTYLEQLIAKRTPKEIPAGTRRSGISTKALERAILRLGGHVSRDDDEDEPYRGRR